jgi:hypothetical protein
MPVSRLHFPEEIALTGKTRGELRQIIARWQALPDQMPTIVKRELSIKGPNLEVRGSAPESGCSSHTGLVFRIEHVMKFLSNVMKTTQGSGGGKPYYSSVEDCEGDRYTATTLSLARALMIYGVHWHKHAEGVLHPAVVKKLTGIEVKRLRLLLLAIDPSENEARSGLDMDEISLRGPVAMQNVYILNDNLELFDQLVDAEAPHYPQYPQYRSDARRWMAELENIELLRVKYPTAFPIIS